MNMKKKCATVSRGRNRRAFQAMVSAAISASVVGSVFAPHLLGAATDTWSGATDNLWGDLNWTGGNNPPQTGDSLVFTSTTGTFATQTDNLMTPSTYSLAEVTFSSTAAAFTINPATAGTNGFTLTGASGISILDAGTTNNETINDNITLSGSQTFENSGNKTLTIGGTVSGTGVTLSTNYTGGTTDTSPNIGTTNNTVFTGNVTLGSLVALGPTSGEPSGVGTPAAGNYAAMPTTTFNSSSSLTTTGNVYVGRGNLVFTGNTIANIGGVLGNDSDWASLTISGNANVTATGGVNMDGTGATGQLNLNGGTLTTSGITGLGSNGTGFGTAGIYTYFNGTQINATGNNATFVSIIGSAEGATTNALIGSSGLLINPEGYSIGIAANLINSTTAFTPGATTGFLTVSGTGTLTLSGVSTYTGATTIGAGSTLTIGGAGQLGSGSYAGNIPNSGTFIYNSSAAQTLSGVISGNGALIVSGAGTLTLSGVNNYMGATTVSAGTLTVGNGTSGSLNSATALTMGTGTFTLFGNTGSATSQTVASLSTAAGTTSSITLNPNGSSNSNATTLTITSNTLSTGANSALNFNLSLGTTNASTSTLGNTVVVWNPTVTNGIIGMAYTVTDAGGTGFATVNGGDIVRFTDPGGDGLPVSTGASTGNYWVDSNYSTSSTSTAGSLVEALSGPVAANTVSVNTANLISGANLALGTKTLTITSVGGMLFSGANPYSITASGPGGLTSTSGGAITFDNYATGTVTISAPILDNSGVAVTFAGTGTTTLGGVNTYTGATTVASGTLQVSNAAALSDTSSVTVVSGAALDLYGTTMTGTTGLTLNGTGTSSSSSVGALTNSSATAGTYAGPVTLGSSGASIGGAGTITLSNAGTITGSGSNLTLQGAGGTVSSIIGTGAGALTVNTTGIWALSNANTYTGTTSVNGGTLELNFAAGSAPASNIVSSSSALSMGGGTLFINGNASSASSQTFNSATIASGASIINVAPGSGANNPTLTLGTLTGTVGTVQFVGPATIGLGNVSTGGNVTITAPAGTGPVGLLVNSAGAAYATVGLYDWASTDTTGGAAGTTIIGGSQVTGVPFYTTLAFGSVTGSNENIDVTGGSQSSTTAYTNDTLRFNTGPVTFQVSQNANFGVRGILVTPNVGANNVTINQLGSGSGRGINNGSSTTLAIFQNNTSGELVFNGASGSGTMLEGTGAYIQSGPGTVFLDSSPDGNGYTGATYLNGGVTEIGGATAADQDKQLGGTVASNVNLNGGTLVGSVTGNLDNGTTAHPVVLGTNGGGLGAVSGTTLTVDGAVSGTGPLVIGIPATNGTNGAPNNGNVTGQLPGTGSGAAISQVLASGNVTLTNVGNTFTGGTVIDSGTLAYNGTQATLGSSSGAMTVNIGGTLNLGASQNLTTGPVSLNGGAISGTGTSVLTGTSYTSTGGSVSAILGGPVPFTNVSGTTILSGANTYTGATTVNGGTLNVTGSIGTSAVTINSGGTLQGGAGATLGSTLSNSAGGGALTLAAATGNLTVSGPITLGNNLAYGSGNYTTLNYTLGGSNAVEKLIDSSTLTVGSGGVYVDISNPTQTGNFTLASYATSSLNNTYFSLSPTTAGVHSQIAGRDTDTLTVNSGTLVLSVAGFVPPVAYWDGAVSSTWSDTSNATYVNWSSNSAGTTDAGNVPGATTDVYLNATGSPSGSPAAGAAPSGSTQPMSLGGLTIINSLTVNGEGTDTIAADGNTLQTNAVGDANITTGNAITVGGAANAFTINAPIVMGGSGGNQTWTNASANTFTVGGNVTGTAAASSTQTLTLANTNAGGTTISGVISDTSTGFGALTAIIVNNTGAGVTTLGGASANTYTGGTTLTAGNLTLGNAGALSTGTVTVNGGTLNLATYSPTITNLQGSGGTIGATGPVTLTVNGGNFSGNITDGSGTVALTSTGNLNLAGSNTYSGQTTVGSGTLQFQGLSAMSPNSAQLNLNGGTLSLLSDSDTTFTTPSLVPGSAATFTLNVGAISTGSGNSLTLSSASAVTVGGNTNQALTINVTGANSDNLILSAGGNGFVFYPFGGVSLVLNPTTANLTVPSNLTGGTAGTPTLSLSGTSINDVFSGIISNSGATVSVTKSGTSTWALTAANTYTGNTVVSGGTLNIPSGASLNSGHVSVTGGVMNLTGTLNGTGTALPIVSATGGTLNADNNGDMGGTPFARKWASVTVGSGGLITLIPSPSGQTNRTVLVVGSNTASGDPTTAAGTTSFTGGTLDLASNDMIVRQNATTSTGELAALTTAAKSGLNGATPWTGTGLTTSAGAATNNTGLAIVVNDTNQSGTTLSGTPLVSGSGQFNNGESTFDNQTVTDGDILVKYTYFGDALLTGSVTSADYLQIDNGFNSQSTATPLTGWYNGDFNYDGVINGDDYTLIDNAYNSQGAAFPTSVSAGPAEMIASDIDQIAGATSSAAVPEPASVSLIAFGAIGLLKRRRRRRGGTDW
jgi:autotransporter-associated beta strand protein